MTTERAAAPDELSRYARELWGRIERLNSVTYFSPQSRQAAKDIGLRGYWMGYFGFRAAPLGPVSPGVVEATFYNFAPHLVRRAIPDAWGFADPATQLAARSASAAAALRTLGEIESVAEAVNEPLSVAVAAAPMSGRPLFTPNRDLALEHPQDDPVAQLWQLCTTLREHRGDGHVGALVAAGLEGLEVHVLITVEKGTDPGVMLAARGFTQDDWAAAVERLQGRGLLSADGGLSPAGVQLRQDVEATTDRLAGRAYAGLDADRRTALLAALDPPAAAVQATGLIPFPNPMGLPTPAAARPS